MISSNEIVTLINALGLNPSSENLNIDDLRYGKSNNYDGRRC